MVCLCPLLASNFPLTMTVHLPLHEHQYQSVRSNQPKFISLAVSKIQV